MNTEELNPKDDCTVLIKHICFGETALIKIARAFWLTLKLKSIVVVVQKTMSMRESYTLSKSHMSSQKIQIRHVLREYYPN